VGGKTSSSGAKATLVLAAAGVLLLATAAVVWFKIRPGRPYVAAGSHELSRAELDRLALSRMSNAVVRGIIQPKDVHSPEVFEKYREETARLWIFRMVLLDEAVRCGYKASRADEKRTKDGLEQALRRLGKQASADEYFKCGTLPENEMRERFREDVLIYKLLHEEVESKIAPPSEAEIEQLRKMRAAGGAVPDRREIETEIRRERYLIALRAFYLKLLKSTSVYPAELAPAEPPAQFGGISP